MYNREEVSDRKLRKEREKLENHKQELEQTVEIKTYLGWQDLPYSEKSRIIQGWNDYYARALKSESFKDFKVQGEAFKEGDIEGVKEIALKARKRLEEGNFMPKPQIIDPWEFSHGVYYQYYKTCEEIKKITKILTGVEHEEFI